MRLLPATLTATSVSSKIGTNTWTWAGTNITHTGQNTVNAGTLQIGNGGTTGNLGTGPITVAAPGATLAFNRSDFITDTNFSAIIGAGNLAKRGAGRLALTKAHTYSGATTIETGVLALTNSGSIANSSNIIISVGALLDVSGTTANSMTLANGKKISGYGSVKEISPSPVTDTCARRFHRHADFQQQLDVEYRLHQFF